MRGAILSMAVLMAAATTLAQAETPTIRSFRAVSSSRVAIPVTPRPPMPSSVTPRTVSTPIRTSPTPHCPNPPTPKPPLSVNIPKPDYNKRTMALIQQNIIMMSAMRAAERPRHCDPSWSARKLARRGCPPSELGPRPLLERAPPPPPLASETIVATAPEAPTEFGAGQN